MVLINNVSLKLCPSFFSITSRQCLFAKTRRLSSASSPSLADDIPTVPLVFDKYNFEESTKSPLIIAHGLFGSKTNNRTVAKQLSQLLTRDVYCIDLRNHGESPHIERHDYPSLAADIEAFIESQKLGKSKPILIGHSMGAKAVMAVGLRKPQLPKLIISVDNAPVSYPYSSGSKFAVYIRALLEITEGKAKPVISRTQADEVLKKIEDSLAVRQFLLTNITRKTKQELNDEFQENSKIYKNSIHNVPVFKSKVPLKILGKAVDSGCVAVWPFDSNEAIYKGDTLFVRGTESTYIPDDVLPEIGRFFPRFEVKDVQAGHWLISENPKQFVEVVRDWIEYKEEKDDDDTNQIITGH